MSIPEKVPGGPSPPATTVRVTDYDLQNIVLFSEDHPGETWIEIDDQHVCDRRDWE